MEHYAMNLTMKAIEKVLPEGSQLLALAGSGFLRAIVWKSTKGFEVSVFREDPNSGDLQTSLTPFDLEHLARLTAIIANTFNQLGDPEDSLTDDLGCLSYCLSCTLGIDLEAIGASSKELLQ